jgi:RepB DNA-primase from phage plasmid
VFGLIADDDRVPGKRPGQRIAVKSTFVINSSPDNYQAAYVFNTRVPIAAAKHTAVALRGATKTDDVTSDVVHYWRIDGTANWPNYKKIHEYNRSREPFPVRVVFRARKSWSAT